MKLKNLIAAPALIMIASLGLAATPAHADTATNHAPVAVPDELNVLQGSFVYDVNVLGNDTDADGDSLFVARVEVDPELGFASQTDGIVTVSPNYDNYVESFDATYYVSDGKEVTVGTLTVNVAKVNNLTLKKATVKRKLVASNGNDYKGVIQYGSFKESAPDGTINLAPNATKTVRIQHAGHEHAKIDWIGFLIDHDGYTTVFAGQGHVKDVRYRGSMSQVRIIAYGKNLSTKSNKFWKLAAASVR